jgi:hypothetical protein
MTYKFNGSAWDKVAGAVSTEIPFATQVDLDAAVAVSTTQTGDIAGLTTAMGNETSARTTAISAEASARTTAIAAEASVRTSEQTAQDTLISSLQSSMATNNTAIVDIEDNMVSYITWNHDSGSVGSFAEDVDIGTVSLGASSGIDGANASAVISGGSLPPGISLSSTGMLTGSMPNQTTSSTFNFQVTVTIGARTSVQDYTITNTADNDAPTWSTASGLLGNSYRVGTPATNTIVAVDPEGGSTTYSLASGTLPGGLSINSSTGEISGSFSSAGEGWAPSNINNEAHDYTLNLRATDSVGNFVDRAFTFRAVNAIPTWNTASGALNFATGGGYNETVSAGDIESSDITYSIVVGTLPPGLSLNVTNGNIYGTSSLTGGQYSFTLRASDPSGGFSDRVFNITDKTECTSSSACYALTNLPTVYHPDKGFLTLESGVWKSTDNKYLGKNMNEWFDSATYANDAASYEHSQYLNSSGRRLDNNQFWGQVYFLHTGVVYDIWWNNGCRNNNCSNGNLSSQWGGGSCSQWSGPNPRDYICKWLIDGWQD